MEDYAKLYHVEIVNLHGAPVLIISDYGMQFFSHFWWYFRRGLGTKVGLSVVFHP